MSFSNFRVAHKISLILAVTGVLMLAGLVALLSHNRHEMYAKKAFDASELVRQAMAVVSSMHEQVSSGKMSEAEGKRLASETIARMRHGNDDYFWIQDSAARMVMHPVKPELNARDMSTFKDPNGKALFVEAAAMAKTPGGGSVSYSWPKGGAGKSQPKISHVERFAAWDWIIGTGVYVDDVEDAFIRSASIEGGSIIGFLLLTGGVFLWVIRRYITAPIQQLQGTMTRVASERDLTLRAGLINGDEIGLAGQGFDLLMAAMEDSLKTIREHAEEVAGAAQQLATASLQVSNGSNNQSEAASTMSAAVEEMTASIAVVSDNTQEVRNLGERAYAQEDEGSKRVGSLGSELVQVRSSVEGMRVTLHQFVESTRAISSLTQQVRDIAEQTNLLALNAAIEAARAGEQGRGFAVVADEVRKLAEHSTKSVAQIDAVTRVIGEQSNSVETAMAESNRSLNEASGLMQRVSEIFAETKETVVETRGGLNEIANALAEQSVATTEIAQNVARIADMAEQNTAAAAQSSSAADRLSQLSEELSATVKRFRVA